MNQNTFLFSFLLLPFLYGGSVNGKLFQTCTSSHGQINSITVSECQNTDSVCLLKRDTNVSISIQFTPTYNASSVQVVIKGEIGGVPIPFVVKPSEACTNYGLVCPLKVNQMETFKLELPIKSIYPTIGVTIIINLMDETNNSVSCLKFKAKIVK
ncbi:Phosphatidylglycerol/phosphatidylinositol transfer protein [Blomia tropicalis]|nr:Phosphatidylglycerol/phosphatidylinositol transfer protein [Blomia tropicalis]